MGKRSPLFTIILVLIVIGFIGQFFRNPGGLIIPLIVFGLIFYFMRFPAGSRHFWPFSRKGPTYRKKPWNWKVFNGKRNDRNDPPFH